MPEYWSEVSTNARPLFLINPDITPWGVIRMQIYDEGKLVYEWPRSNE